MNTTSLVSPFACPALLPRPHRSRLLAAATRARGAFALVLTLAAAVAAAAPMDNWTKITLPGDVSRTPNDVIFANGQYSAACYYGRIQHSVDGHAWSVVQTPSTLDFNSIAYGNGRYVAVGMAKTIVTSTNGVAWTMPKQGAPNAGSYRQVIFAHDQFLVLGDAGEVELSTNGTDWISGHLGTEPSFVPAGVAWGDGQYVVIGSGATLTSPDGVTWTEHASDLGSSLYAITYANGRFVAGGDALLAYSDDGVEWTPGTASFASPYTRMWETVFLNGRFFACGSGGVLMSSPDGAGWMLHTTGTTAELLALAYNGSRLLLIRYALGNAGASGPYESDLWAPVVVTPPPGDEAGRIENLSTRGWVGTDATQMIAGFVIHGSTPKQVLIRAVGPTLSGYGVQGALTDPQIKLFDSASVQLGGNNDWGTNANLTAIAAASTAVSAFALPAGSKDAVLLTTLAPGSYTIQISGVNNTTGVALAEVYDCEAPGGTRLVNISSRGFIGTGDNVSIPGFIVSGDAPKKLLIRGVGPTLGSYGVPGVIADPTIALVNAAQVTVAANDDWSTAPNLGALTAATAQVSAFPLAAGSHDAALLVTVEPGLYTVVVSGVGATTGVSLVEVYEVP